MDEVTEMFDVEADRMDGVTESANGVDEWIVLKAKSFSAEDRREMASEGVALPDGSFPIPDKKHLESAIRMVGLSKKPRGVVRRHIIRRAKALGLSDMIPDSWRTNKMGKTEKATSQSLSSTDSTLVGNLSQAYADIQASIAEMKSLLADDTPAAPDPELAKRLESLEKALAATSDQAGEKVKETSDGKTGDKSEDRSGRGKDGKFVSRKKYKRLEKKYKKAEKKPFDDKAHEDGSKDESKKDKAKKVEADRSIKSEVGKAVKPPAINGFANGFSFEQPEPQTPAQVIKSIAYEKGTTDEEREEISKALSMEVLSEAIFAKWGDPLNVRSIMEARRR